MAIQPELGANHVDTENFRFCTGSGCVLSLGTYSAEAAAKPHGHHVSKHQHAKKNKLHPACTRYLERRAAWYRYKGNKAELRENHKAAKAFRGLPYAEQKIQCQAAYRAFDDFDHGKFRCR